MNILYKISLVYYCLSCVSLNTQERKIDSLYTLALEKTAEKFYQELAQPQSTSERNSIVQKWKHKAGTLFEPSETNANGEVMPSTVTTETVVERFQKKYFTKLEMLAVLEDSDHIINIIPGNKCIYLKGNEHYCLTIADIKRTGITPVLAHKIGFQRYCTRFASDKSLMALFSQTDIAPLLAINFITKTFYTLEGHTDLITDAALTPDTTKIISASRDGTINVWDLMTGRCLHALRTCDKSSPRITLTPENNVIAEWVSPSLNKMIHVWNITTGEYLQSLESCTLGKRTVTNDGSKIISIGDNRLNIDNKNLLVWDTKIFDCLYMLQGHTDSIYNFVVTNDNTKIISFSDDQTIKVWDIKTGGCLHTIAWREDKIKNFAVTSDGTKLLSVLDKKICNIWDLNTGNCVTITVPKKWDKRFIFSPDNRKIIFITNNCTIELWDLITGKHLYTQTIQSGRIHAINFITNNKALIYCDNALELRDIDTGIQLQLLRRTFDKVITNNTLVGLGDRIYQLEGLESIIERMQKPGLVNSIKKFFLPITSVKSFLTPPAQTYTLTFLIGAITRLKATITATINAIKLTITRQKDQTM